MSPRPPRRTHFFCRFDRISHMGSVRVCVRHARVQWKRRQIFDEFQATGSRSGYNNTRINEDVDKWGPLCRSSSCGLPVWLHPSLYQAEGNQNPKSHFICLCAQSFGHFPKLVALSERSTLWGSCQCTATRPWKVCISAAFNWGQSHDPSYDRCTINHLFFLLSHSLKWNLITGKGLCSSVTQGARFAGTRAPARDTWGRAVSDVESVESEGIVPWIGTSSTVCGLAGEWSSNFTGWTCVTSAFRLGLKPGHVNDL